MFRATDKLLEYILHSDKYGCVGVTYNFISHKSTIFDKFLALKLYTYLNRFLHLHIINIVMKQTATQHTQVILHVGKCITSLWVSILTQP